jgi:hypothetical protein
MRFGVVVLTVVWVRVAFAQSPEPPAEAAAVLFREGRVLLDAGKPDEACAKFEASFQLESGAAGTMLNLGICNEQRGKLATANKWFRRAHAHASEHDLNETAGVAKERSDALAGKIATVKIELGKTPAGAIVTIDGARIEAAELAKLEIDAGGHVLEVSVANMPPVRREFQVTDGIDSTVAIQIPVARPAKRLVTIDRGRGQRRLAYVIGGAGLGVLAGTAVLGFVGKREYDAGETPDTWDRWQSIVRYGGTSMFLVGASAVAYAAVLYRRAPGRERVEVTPVIGHDVVGFTYAKTF